jgi:hypothetical protein
VELTCFKETFRLKISTRHYVATRGRSRIWTVIVMTFIFWEGKLKILLNTGELMDCKNTVYEDFCHQQIPVAARPKAWACGHSLFGNSVSNFAEGISVCLSVVSVVCCQAEVSATGRSLA